MNISLPELLGYTFGAIAIAGACSVVLRRDAVVAAMNLVLTFFCLSGIYLLLGFPFLATVQILVYAGAIMVLFLFVIMLLGLSRLGRTPIGARSGIGALIALATIAYGAVIALQIASKNTVTPTADAAMSESVEGVASLLFRDGLVLPFEVTGVILLAAMVGVVVLGRRDFKNRGLAEIARERAFDPRPLVTHHPDAAAPDGLNPSGSAAAEVRP